jgi:glycosyltransferase involved in cell wall biosynthesis
MKRVVHLTSSHPWNDTRIWSKECKSLADAGYDVTLIVPTTETGRRDGIRIRPVRPTASRADRFVKAPPAILKAALNEPADLFHFHDPELVPVGVILQALKAPVIYDVHEETGKSLQTREWIPASIRPAVGKVFDTIDRFASRFLAGIVSATPAIGRHFEEISRRHSLVQNFPHADELSIARSGGAYANRPKHFAFVGKVTAVRGIREMVDAIQITSEHHGSAQLSIAGSFAPAGLQDDLERQPGWQGVDFKGWCNRQEVSEMLGRARAGLVVFHPAPNHIQAQPNKLFEYMSAGIPVIASDFPLWREIVEGVGCGLLVDPEDSTAIAEAMTWILDNPEKAAEMGERGRNAVRERLNWESEKRSFLALYDDVIGAPLA